MACTGGPPPGQESQAPPSAPQSEGKAPTAPAVPAAAASGEVVARYGSRVLTADQLASELSRLPERSRRLMSADGRKRFVENYVLNDLLFDEGTRQGMANDAEIERQVTDLRKRLIVQRLVRNLQNISPVTDEEVKKYYEANKEMYSTTTIKARHILVKDEAKAKELLGKVKADPSQFADLAKANSTDTGSASKGGDLGFFGHGRMVPDFERAAFTLKNPGDLSDVVKTPYGYHIIQLEERKPGAEKPFDQVKEQIRATLRNQALQAKTQSFYDELKQKGNVSIDDAAVEKVAAKVAPPEASPGAEPAGGRDPHGMMNPHGGH